MQLVRRSICALDFKRLATPGMQPPPISSPCIKVCAVSGLTNQCIGCGRTLQEIARWGSMEEAERKAIMAALPARLANATR